MRWQILRVLSRYWLVLPIILLIFIIKYLIDESVNENVFLGDAKSVRGSFSKCNRLSKSPATINTENIFPTLNFEPPISRSFWNSSYDMRSNAQASNSSVPPLKVFILTHSHNDPGWLQTFTDYFENDTKKILDLIVEKLMEYKEMRFIWTEISFLDLWWQQASDEQKINFKALVAEKRLEIMTGGWVMTDEAGSHYHAMLDQLIEGNQWVKKNLNFSPKVGFSIDPFGQGSTIPHLLASSGFDMAIIQRIHYSWKEYLAWHQAGDFYWKTLWESQQSSKYTLLTKNMPFDIYSTKHSCGPRPSECLKFEFRKIFGTYIESQAESITDENVEKNADLLLKQYHDTASLYPHNVALVFIGGDFTFNNPLEYQQQYENYQKLIKFVNANKNLYKNATIQFGTPSDYYQEVSKRMQGNFPTLVGDFFPYSDIFSSGRPAYWTGYFTTRPFHKYMSRDLEHNLRNAEILFTIAFNKIKNLEGQKREEKRLEKDYEMIVKARRNLGLFQHHDAITGTSRSRVTIDYLMRLLISIRDTIKIQEQLLELLTQPLNSNKERNFLSHELKHPAIDKFPEKKLIDIVNGKEINIVIFNSLAQDRVEPISLLVSTNNVIVKSSKGYEVPYQVNKIVNQEIFELIFIAKLAAMSSSSFTLSLGENSDKNVGKIVNDFVLENDKMMLNFNNETGFLDLVFNKITSKGSLMRISFNGYKSVVGSSGSYLFKPQNQEFANIFAEQQSTNQIIITKGPIVSDVTVIAGPLLTHKIRIFNTKTHLDSAISMINDIDFGPINNNHDLEMVMRIHTSIKNKNELFTDQNGFLWQPRRNVDSLGVEANYYPITTCAFIQDDTMRMSLMTTHAQGATAFRQSELEIMLDRRTTHDDNRGMGEGVLDSIKMQHQFYLTLEFFKDDHITDDSYQLPSLLVQHLTNALNYPANIFISQKKPQNDINLFNYKLPCDFHLVNLRAMTDDELDWLPSQSSLFILHRFGYDCELINDYLANEFCRDFGKLDSVQFVKDVKVRTVERTTLTGLESKFAVNSFLGDQQLESMEIRTYNVTFT